VLVAGASTAAAAVFGVVFALPDAPAAAGPATSDSRTAPAPTAGPDRPLPAAPPSSSHRHSHRSSGGAAPLQPPAALPGWSSGRGSASSGAS
jgi:hypothetical protein